MRRDKSKQRGVWTDEESKLLGKLVEERGEKSWNEIAEVLNTQYGNNKTGKQCRERFRNYVNPNLEKSEWKPNEKLLFVILHQVYGNQWTSISKHLNSRSDVAIKNYFYCIIRKATKLVKSNIVPLSCLRKPEKFYSIYSVLTFIKNNYLPVLKSTSKLPKCSPKERIVLNILKERKLNEEIVLKYQEQMVNDFKRTHETDKLPTTVSLSLNAFNISKNKIKDLILSHNLYNLKPLSDLIVISLSQETVTSLPLPSDTLPLKVDRILMHDIRQPCASLPSYPPPECIRIPYGNGMQPYPPYSMVIPQSNPTPPETAVYSQPNLYWGGMNQPYLQVIHSYCPPPANYVRTLHGMNTQPSVTYRTAKELEPPRKLRFANDNLFKM